MAKKSNVIIKVEKWIIKYGNKESGWEGLSARRLPNGKWICEIELPIIGIFTIAVSKTKHKAILSSATKAYAVICEFLHCNMNKTSTIDSIRSMGIQIDKDGKFVSTQLPKKQNERMTQSIAFVEKTDINKH